MLAIVLRSGRGLTVEEVRARIGELLPKFAVPRFVEFVDELPMTPSGKVEKHKLRVRGATESTFDARLAQEGKN
jgi:crotonobetaine/carnitine-CoA ligase